MHYPRTLSQYTTHKIRDSKHRSQLQTARRKKLVKALEFPTEKPCHWNSFAEFCKTTSCHGFSLLEVSKHLIGKLFWASIIFASSVILFVHIIGMSYNFIFNPSVYSEIVYEYKPVATLPIIMICNQSPFLKSKLAGKFIIITIDVMSSRVIFLAEFSAVTT